MSRGWAGGLCDAKQSLALGFQPAPSSSPSAWASLKKEHSVLWTGIFLFVLLRLVPTNPCRPLLFSLQAQIYPLNLYLLFLTSISAAEWTLVSLAWENTYILFPLLNLVYFYIGLFLVCSDWWIFTEGNKNNSWSTFKYISYCSTRIFERRGNFVNDFLVNNYC